ncbi:MAG: hypothetical protein Q7S11_01565 [bacterium]|nr:hypothetical protein [bacterium]
MDTSKSYLTGCKHRPKKNSTSISEQWVLNMLSIKNGNSIEDLRNAFGNIGATINNGMLDYILRNMIMRGLVFKKPFYPEKNLNSKGRGCNHFFLTTRGGHEKQKLNNKNPEYIPRVKITEELRSGIYTPALLLSSVLR